MLYLHVKIYHVNVQAKVVVVVDLVSVDLVDLNLPALMDSLPYRFALTVGGQGELFRCCENTFETFEN